MEDVIFSAFIMNFKVISYGNDEPQMNRYVALFTTDI